VGIDHANVMSLANQPYSRNRRDPTAFYHYGHVVVYFALARVHNIDIRKDESFRG
jgi:hypothetical protein